MKKFKLIIIITILFFLMYQLISMMLDINSDKGFEGIKKTTFPSFQFLNDSVKAELKPLQFFENKKTKELISVFRCKQNYKLLILELTRFSNVPIYEIKISHETGIENDYMKTYGGVETWGTPPVSIFWKLNFSEGNKHFYLGLQADSIWNNYSNDSIKRFKAHIKKIGIGDVENRSDLIIKNNKSLYADFVLIKRNKKYYLFLLTSENLPLVTKLLK